VNMRPSTVAGVLIAASVLATATAAHAFCGFYVAGSDKQLLNDATQVVLMRKGTRTVLSMQNNYKGPPDAFAMVVPVPVVLHEKDVKTLPREVFEAVERMGAPRLVEYWEMDPCAPDIETKTISVVTGGAGGAIPPPSRRSSDLGVVIEAQFKVGEYEIVILSAKDSTGLDTWLRREKYNIPAGAEPLLRPYVENGMKFFVAKVNPAKVTFNEGRAELSPLRFHYDSEQFNLPIRLGLANSSGKQDLIVNIFAPQQRYEVANYKNVTIPTNITVNESVKDKFGAFYAALFDATLEKNPGAVVTEYAWAASTCDPCPGPTLGQRELMTLGLDVLDPPTDGPLGKERENPPQTASPQTPGRGRPTIGMVTGMVLTRLHARYGKDITNDLEFAAAEPIVGGREHIIDPQTRKLEEGAQPSTINNFQGRYAIRHPWTGPVSCQNPQRGRWGGPPVGVTAELTKPALDLAFAPRGTVQIANEVAQDVPELGIVVGKVATMTPVDPGKPSAEPVAATKKKTGCGCGTSGDASGGLVLAVLALVWRRTRRTR
jgi:MYXO-CTERM domain-containing protein